MKPRLIAIREGCSDLGCCHALHLLGGRVVRRLALLRAVVVDHLADDAVRLIAARDDVEGVEDDFVIRAFPARAGAAAGERAPAGARAPVGAWSGFSSRSALYECEIEWPGWKDRPSGVRIPWGVRRIGAPKIWKESKGEGVRVAVVDTGIDLDHPDLEPAVVGGYSAVGTSYDDDNGHGTHVAGIVAAAGVWGGVLGVAPKAKLLSVKVLDGAGGGRLSYLLDGLEWVAQSDADIVNLSLGATQGSPLLLRAIDRICERGKLVISAAGNSGPGADSVGYPARYAQVIAVGALTRTDEIASFSSRGPQVDVAAPGVDIFSTWPDGGYRTLSGTSMASPHVAGLAALLWRSGGGREGVQSALLRTANPLRGWNTCAQGLGVADAVSAMRFTKAAARRRGGVVL